jgi:hypothetical protein
MRGASVESLGAAQSYFDKGYVDERFAEAMRAKECRVCSYKEWK